jgi:hypothetical protein
MLALRNPAPMLSTRWQLVALQHDHLVEVTREHSRGTQPRDTAAQHDRDLAPHSVTTYSYGLCMNV